MQRPQLNQTTTLKADSFNQPYHVEKINEIHNKISRLKDMRFNYEIHKAEIKRDDSNKDEEIKDLKKEENMLGDEGARKSGIIS